MRGGMRRDTIAELQNDTRIHGHCPHCDDEFPLRDALLFYADGPLPGVARERLELRQAEVSTRAAALRERRRRAHEGAMQRAIDVNVGKILEKVAPVCDGFGCPPRDCRPLFDPIDYVVFGGLSGHGEVKSITFVDVKTGGGSLNQRQRQIKAAVEAGKVEWQEYAVEGRA